MTLAGVPGTLLANAALLAAASIGMTQVRQRTAHAWIAAAGGLLLLALLRDALPSIPPVVPAFHFWRYLMSGATLLAGAACAALVARAPGPLRRAAPLLMLALVVWSLPAYRRRFDFVYGRAVATERRPELIAASAYLHEATPDSAIVLGSRGLSLEVIGPAGRKVVGVTANWSNPYVEAEPRIAARDAMLAHLAAGRFETFERLADAHGVTHAVGMGEDECGAMERAGFRLMYRFTEVCVFARRR